MEENVKTNKFVKLIYKNRKILLFIILAVIAIYSIIGVIKLVKKPTNTFLVEQGQIYQEEIATGYIIRDETVVKGEKYKNGMVQIKTEGERVAKDEAIFRYYSNGEENLVKKIQDLDKKIEEAMAKEESLFSPDTKVIENQINSKLDMVYCENDLQKIKEYKKDINTYITKKAKITGELSPAGSYLRKLINERKDYENKLNSGAEYLKSPISGVVSYRVDGYEEILTPKDFGNITKEFLEELNLKTGQIIAANEESGKIIDNYYCYIAVVLKSENAKKAVAGDKVKLRLPSKNEVNAKIEYINAQDENEYVLIFKIEKCVEELINYRKISFNVIWWSDSGKKVPNSSIRYDEKGENKVPYVVRTRAGYEDKILVKILSSNDKYSIVTSYTRDELKELGYTSEDEELKTRRSIALYDEILMNP